MRFPAVQFDVNLVPGVQMQDDAVAGVVVVLVCVLRDGAGSDLRMRRERREVGPGSSVTVEHISTS